MNVLFESSLLRFDVVRDGSRIGSKPAGNHIVEFQAANLPPGVYICQLTAGSFHAQKKMLLMK